MSMIHRQCGGEIFPDPSKTYEFEMWNDDVDPPRMELQHETALVCSRCGKEVVGDAEIFLEGYDEDRSDRFNWRKGDADVISDPEIREAILPSEY